MPCHAPVLPFHGDFVDEARHEGVRHQLLVCRPQAYMGRYVGISPATQPPSHTAQSPSPAIRPHSSATQLNSPAIKPSTQNTAPQKKQPTQDQTAIREKCRIIIPMSVSLAKKILVEPERLGYEDGDKSLSSPRMTRRNR